MTERAFISVDQGYELLAKLLERTDLQETVEESFADMSQREPRWLTNKQLLWIQAIAIQKGLLEEPVRNDWSSRSKEEQERIRGREVATPAVLLNRPLKPPGRR